MNLIPTSVSRTVSRQLLKNKKNSPAILFAAGVVGFGATTVLASIATLKVADVLDQTDAELESLNMMYHQRDDISEAAQKRLIGKVYVHSGLQIAKLYAPAVVVGVASVAALTKSHKILSNRNAGLAAAYTALDRGVKEYRKRVEEELGSEKERDLYQGVEVCEIEDPDKPGKTKKVRDKTREGSAYSVTFDRHNGNWQPEQDYNHFFLKSQQNYANHRLHTKGHILLNDVFDALGFERTVAGAVVGWALGNGDDYVDFGCFVGGRSDFQVSPDGSILLDFNVDGVVYELI